MTRDEAAASDNPASDDPASDDRLDHQWWADISLPVLLDEARRVYGEAIRAELTSAGFHDLPAHGPRLIGGIARNGPGLSETADFARVLRISESAATKLLDPLVERRYLERVLHGDRDRLVVTLTDRGRAAAAAVRRAVDHVDGRLVNAVGSDNAHAMRRVLGSLVNRAGRQP